VPLRLGLVGAPSEPAAVKLRYKPRRTPDKTGRLRRLVNEVGDGMKFIGNLESEPLGRCISQTESYENNLY